MATATVTLTPAAIHASQSLSASSTIRAARDMRTKRGGLMTFKVTNGATGPTTPTVFNVMVAHDSGSTPATGAAGSVWKTIWSFSGSTANSAVVEPPPLVLPPCCHVQVEIVGGNQATTVEAHITDYTAVEIA